MSHRVSDLRQAWTTAHRAIAVSLVARTGGSRYDGSAQSPLFGILHQS